MAQTNLMRADDIVAAFNGATDRKYWRASIAGTRVNPEVNFNSRAAFVKITYRVATDDFTVSFSKTSAAFGDFLASTYRSLAQIVASLVAAGLPFSMPDEASAVLRIEYNPATKAATVHVDHAGANWVEVEPLPFKAPVRTPDENNEKTVLSAIDL